MFIRSFEELLWNLEHRNNEYHIISSNICTMLACLGDVLIYTIAFNF